MRSDLCLGALVLGGALAFTGPGCGGSSSSLAVTPPSAAVTAGGGAITFTATPSNPASSVRWVLSTATGTLSSATGPSVTYTPPARTAGEIAVTLTASATGLTTSVIIVVTPAVGGAPAGLTISPGAPQVRIGDSVQLAALDSRDDGSTSDVTLLSTWSSSDPSVVSVAGDGRATPARLAAGSATITATLSGKSGSATVHVVPPIGPGVDDDPLLPQQWHLRNTGQSGYAQNAGTSGQDVSAAATYLAGYGGRGVKVAVVDTGLEIAHEDLADNVAPGSWNFLTDTSDPTSSETDGDHGTSVAGLIAAVRNNGVGGMGVAPLAVLNAYNYISSDQSTDKLIASLGGSSSSPRSDDVWVFNQSYGVSTTAPIAVDPLEEAQYVDGVTTLRDGLGAVYVKSAGNGFRDFVASGSSADCSGANEIGTSCQNASMDPYNRLPYNVVVGALDARGKKSSYSSAGSALWVSAPGGEYGCKSVLVDGSSSTFSDPLAYDPAMVTTDQSTCAKGYATTNGTVAGADTYSLSQFDRGAEADGFNSSCNYTNTFNGTSSAAPVTSGVVALILEANPSLTWRDVKHILASTARQVDPDIPAVTTDSLAHGTYVAELPWTTNAAGYRFHNGYGFGAVNVDSAVEMAKTYSVDLGALATTGWLASGALALAIPDADATGVSATRAVPASPDLTIEAVQIGLTLSGNTWLGDYGVELTSPSGTKSILLNIMNGFSQHGGAATLYLTSNAFYGERAAGAWTLKVVDGWGDVTGTLTGWQLRIYGH